MCWVPGRIYDESYYPQFDPVTALRQAKSCMPFIRAVMEADFAQVEQYKNELVGYMQDLPLEQGQSLALLYLYNLYYEMGFYDMQVAYKLGLDHRLYQRLRAIETQRDLVIYFTSVLRRSWNILNPLRPAVPGPRPAGQAFSGRQLHARGPDAGRGGAAQRLQ